MVTLTLIYKYCEQLTNNFTDYILLITHTDINNNLFLKLSWRNYSTYSYCFAHAVCTEQGLHNACNKLV